MITTTTTTATVAAPRWHALTVLARQEKAAHSELTRRGFDAFLPVRVERRAWSDRIQSVELALFPGYVFVRTALDIGRRVELLKVRGAQELVGRIPGDPRIARAIPDDEIESLRAVVQAGRAIDPVTRMVPGMRVRVARGPLAGASGVLEQGVDGQRRLVVLVALLGRGVRARLSADDVLEDLAA